MLVIPDIWAVGMHHWGGRSLTVGVGYTIEWDENNPKDPSAVCIKEDGKIKAYLKREHAFIVSTLIKRGISRVWLLKPKEEPVVKTQRVGPQQRCHLAGCKCRGGTRISSWGAHLKKLRRTEGGAKNFGVFRVMKNHDFAPKKSYFFNFRGGGGTRCAPSGSAPEMHRSVTLS